MLGDGEVENDVERLIRREITVKRYCSYQKADLNYTMKKKMRYFRAEDSSKGRIY